MTLKRSTRSAFLLSVLSLILCFSMLLGTTFAWFTDTAKTGVNKIQAGTLKIDLHHLVGEEWVSVKKNDGHKVFNYDKWEPGYTQYETLKVTNDGTLALKFKLTSFIDADDPEKTYTDANGNVFKLSDVIDVYVTEGIPSKKPESFAEIKADTVNWKNAGTLSSLFADADGIAYGILLPAGQKVEEATTLTAEEKLYAKSGESVMTVALHMREEAGNEYQGLSLGGMYLQLVATQQTYESDSFDHMYDEFAEYDGEISSAESLALALATGGTYKLTKNITLDSAVTVAEGVEVVLDLGDKKITGSNSKSTNAVIQNNGTMTITNGTVENTTVNGASAIYNYGTMVIDGATIVGAPSDTSAGTAFYAVNSAGNGSQLTVNNSSISGRGAIGATNGTKVEVNGGTYHTPEVAWGHAVYAYDEGTEVVINDGTFSEGYEMSGDNWGMYQIYSGNKAKVTVYGGTFMEWDCANGYDLCTATEGEIVICGGTFAENPSSQNNINYVADGYIVTQNGDGTWTVTDSIQLTPDNYSTTVITSNTKYALSGDFGGENVSFVMAKGVENVVFNGASASNINELIIIQNGILIDNANDHVGERSGKVTVSNFNVLSQINVFACKTEVEICNNKAEALMVYAGNCALNIHHNEIDANFESHPTYKSENETWNTNDYGVALNIYDYELWFDNNTVTDALSHAIGINGWEGTFDTGDENVIQSFTNNKITVNSTAKTERAALKIWDDETYASNDDDTNVVNATAQAFIDAVLADGNNTFTIEEGKNHTIFCFYNVKTND